MSRCARQLLPCAFQSCYHRDYSDLITALQLTDGALRNKQRVALGCGYRTDATVLSRTQHVSGLGNIPAMRIAPVLDQPGDPQRRNFPFPDMNFRRIELVQVRSGHAGAVPRLNQIALGKIQVLLLAESEIDLDRIDVETVVSGALVVVIKFPTWA